MAKNNPQSTLHQGYSDYQRDSVADPLMADPNYVAYISGLRDPRKDPYYADILGKDANESPLIRTINNAFLESNKIEEQDLSNQLRADAVDKVDRNNSLREKLKEGLQGKSGDDIYKTAESIYASEGELDPLMRVQDQMDQRRRNAEYDLATRLRMAANSPATQAQIWNESEMARQYGIKTAEDFDKPAAWKAGPNGSMWRTDPMTGEIDYGNPNPYYSPHERAPRNPEGLDIINKQTNQRMRIDGNDLGLVNQYYGQGWEKAGGSESSSSQSFADMRSQALGKPPAGGSEEMVTVRNKKTGETRKVPRSQLGR